MAIVHLFHLTKASSFHLANVAQTTQSQVENEERIHSKGNPVFHNTRASKDADTGCQGPCDENKIDGNSSNRVELKCGEECCDDEWEEGISDYADGLSKGADGLLATIHREEGQVRNIHIPTQQLDLKCNQHLAQPDHCENTAEDKICLVLLCADAEQHTQ